MTLIVLYQMREGMKMRFNELAQSAEHDEFNKWELDDTRRPKLTLKHLNRMRNRQEKAQAEHMEMTKQYKQMYSSAEPASE